MRNGAPPLLKEVGLDEQDAARVSVALSAMLARVMITSVIPGESSKDLERAIKVSSFALTYLPVAHTVGKLPARRPYGWGKNARCPYGFYPYFSHLS